ncbi:class I SAM-dependent methyltransferase [Reichenbachiella sp.]|uniref:class I SAM-dependent methyltransferase n=1 Tax=Reichenbachiella sp. TaxID=2184521 RepID=UPI003BB06B0F
MKKPLDRFSVQSHDYKKHRPIYPIELYKEILQPILNYERCWDCATGNGQAAQVLSAHFERVEATDISENQLAQAPKLNNVSYSVQRAEETNFPDNHFDLITVGQAIHWFDFDAFNQEVRRVSKPGAIVAIWGYGLLKIDKDIDALTTEFDSEIVGPYWDIERRHIDSAYSSIPFPFSAINVRRSFYIEEEWELPRLEGYFNSWSCVQNYKKQKNGENPVPELMRKITPHWTEKGTKKVTFPIFLRLGRILK